MEFEQDTAPAVTIRDSAGIRIVENHAPEWAAADFWTIDPEPVIVIGGDPAVARATADSVHLIWRVEGLNRLSDGRVAVLSSGDKSLRLFEPSGRLSKSIGRAGEGPGEFNHPGFLQVLPGDILAVWSDSLDFPDFHPVEENSPDAPAIASSKPNTRSARWLRVVLVPPAF